MALSLSGFVLRYARDLDKPWKRLCGLTTAFVSVGLGFIAGIDLIAR
jgi:hypothetical protein